jgi:hypothetical protein
VFPSDLQGVNPATLNEMLLYYRLTTKWSGLGDSAELSRVGFSHTRAPSVRIRKRASQFSLKLTKDEKG